MDIIEVSDDRTNLVDFMQGNLLPIGFRDENGSWQRSYQLRNLSARELKLIHDNQFRKKSPIQWMARTVALLLESLGGHSVYSHLAEHKFAVKSIPACVGQLNAADLTFLLIAGHIKNFGIAMEDIPFKCPECDKKVSFKADLSQLKINLPPADFKFDAEGHEFEVVTVDLDNGYTMPGEGKATKLKTYEVAIPNLQHMLKAEPKMRSAADNIFDECVTFNAILRVFDTDMTELDALRMRALKENLILDLAASDATKLNRALNSIPHPERVLDVTCPSCGEETRIPLSNDLLFPRG